MSEDENQVNHWIKSMRNLEEAAQRHPDGIAAQYLAKGNPESRFPEEAFDRTWKKRIFPKKIISAEKRRSAQEAEKETLKILERW